MKYLRRLMWFAASKMLIYTIIVAVLILAFYISMNAANIYVLLNDGLKQRMDVILTREDPGYLNTFFQADFLANDEQLQTALSPESAYLDYKINGFDTAVTLEWIWSWPWEDTAQATILFRVPSIRGTVVASKAALVRNGQLAAAPPQWPSGRYRMEIRRTGGKWKISKMVQTQFLIENTPTPAPTLSPSQPPA